MKKTLLIASLFFCGMMLVPVPTDAQTRKEKKAAKKAEWQFEQQKKELERQRVLDSIKNANARPASNPAGATFELPCSGVGTSDKEYFRQLGIGKDIDLSLAQRMAIQSAKSIMRDRLGEQVKGLVTDYSKTYSKSSKGSDLEGILEREFTSVVDKALDDADNPCEKAAQLNTGEFQYYYVIEIRKNELADKLADAISGNDKLRTEYDRDQFRKYAEEYLQKQKEFSSAQ